MRKRQSDFAVKLLLLMTRTSTNHAFLCTRTRQLLNFIIIEKATADSGGRQEELTGLTSCVKDLKKTFAQVAAMPTSTVASHTTDTAGIRLRGVPESSSGDALQRELDDLEEVRKVFLHLNVNCTVTGLKRFGRRDTSKPGNCRTLIVNVSNQEDKRIILLCEKNETLRQTNLPGP